MLAVYRVDWTEYESGWGHRPDGSTLHASKELANKYIKDYWDKQPSGPVPYEYTKPGDPYLFEVDLELLKKVEEKGSIWM